jgi:hypothetical protein
MDPPGPRGPVRDQRTRRSCLVPPAPQHRCPHLPLPQRRPLRLLHLPPPHPRAGKAGLRRLRVLSFRPRARSRRMPPRRRAVLPSANPVERQVWCRELHLFPARCRHPLSHRCSRARVQGPRHRPAPVLRPSSAAERASWCLARRDRRAGRWTSGRWTRSWQERAEAPRARAEARAQPVVRGPAEARAEPVLPGKVGVVDREEPPGADPEAAAARATKWSGGPPTPARGAHQFPRLARRFRRG